MVITVTCVQQVTQKPIGSVVIYVVTHGATAGKVRIVFVACHALGIARHIDPRYLCVAYVFTELSNLWSRGISGLKVAHNFVIF